jgi:uncharacterized protein YqcC (DUF446 family)
MWASANLKTSPPIATDATDHTEAKESFHLCTHIHQCDQYDPCSSVSSVASFLAVAQRSALVIHIPDLMSANLQADVLRYADLIEAEMRRIGYWQNQPLRPEQMQFKQAFAMDTMAFTQWLQFVFLPRVREAAAANQFPASSSVGTQAIREFDCDPNAGDLTTLLAEFDALFD